ncbi:spermatid-specific linker histone H1-like protein [Ochotona princeps]|uniref:spermatid-specific linker histone H1-like protein n=1 Tax=Ochotona princeps TaxID=9978 RepID=UPI002714790A|nr:spermatid-specific linker histone H1-like protein [Ochotona princeps]
MQKDTSPLPPSAPLVSNISLSENQQASTSGLTNNEPGSHSHPKVQRKPSMSKVILGFLANKGRRSRVSQVALKKALAATGYDMTRNTWRFKLALNKLMDKGLLKQVTGKGTTGSFRLSRKQASKFKLKAKRGQKQRKSGQRRAGRRQARQNMSPLDSTEGRKRPFKGVRKVAKRSHNS